MDERIRAVLVDGDDSDRSARVVALALRDAGMEVVYTGLHRGPDQIAETVVQEDADAVGLVGVDPAQVARLAERLRERGLDDVAVFTAGAADDLPGVTRAFPEGTVTAEIVDWVRSTVGSR